MLDFEGGHIGDLLGERAKILTLREIQQLSVRYTRREYSNECEEK